MQVAQDQFSQHESKSESRKSPTGLSLRSNKSWQQLFEYVSVRGKSPWQPAEREVWRRGRTLHGQIEVLSVPRKQPLSQWVTFNEKRKPGSLSLSLSSWPPLHLEFSLHAHHEWERGERLFPSVWGLATGQSWHGFTAGSITKIFKFSRISTLFVLCFLQPPVTQVTQTSTNSRGREKLMREVFECWCEWWKKNHVKHSKTWRLNVDQSEVMVSTSTTCRTLNQTGLHGRMPRKTPLLRKRHKKERLIFAKQYLDKPQCFWENVLWTDETKIELSGNAHQQFVYRWCNKAYKEKKTLPTVKHGGGSIMLCCIW